MQISAAVSVYIAVLKHNEAFVSFQIQIFCSLPKFILSKLLVFLKPLSSINNFCEIICSKSMFLDIRSIQKAYHMSCKTDCWMNTLYSAEFNYYSKEFVKYSGKKIYHDLKYVLINSQHNFFETYWMVSLKE